MTEKKHRRSVPDRARRRAIRAHAARAGVSYSVAARLLDGGVEATGGHWPHRLPRRLGRTPRWLFAVRERRSYDLRVRDTRLAVRLPLGRAAHLTERFPTLRGDRPAGAALRRRGPPGHARDALRGGRPRTARAARRPPTSSPGSRTWARRPPSTSRAPRSTAPPAAGSTRTAGACGRASRRPWPRPKPAADRELHWAAVTLRYELESLSVPASVDGARHTLDALLVASAGGHAPGTRVRILARPHRGRAATIVGVRWAPTGPPVGYEVRPHATATTVARLAPGPVAARGRHSPFVPLPG